MKVAKHRGMPPVRAIIYCRVSSERQVREGDGLGSQETACRQFLEAKKLPIVGVFRDEGISGALSSRPALHEILAFLDQQKEPFFVCVYDIKRLARDTGVFVEIVAELKKRGARLVSPTHSFGDSSGEIFVTEVLAAAAALERRANREQVISRQKSRMLDGYVVFGRPVGYEWQKDKAKGGKILVPLEPAASGVRELFDGFAAGRFRTLAEAARFIERDERIPVRTKGKVNDKRAKQILSNVVYAGYVERPDWGVPITQGKHQALVPFSLFERVQERLGLKPKTITRADISQDFPLRGFALCSCCGGPLTASWSKGRSAKHPYYRCKSTKAKCSLAGKSIPRQKIEGDFASLLTRVAPSKAVLDLAKAITVDLHEQKAAAFKRGSERLQKQRDDLGRRIGELIQQRIKTVDTEIQSAYDDEIKRLRREKVVLDERAERVATVDDSLVGALGTVFSFLEKPQQIWEKGELEDKRLVCQIVFGKQVPYSQKDGFGTALTALPFRFFQDLDTQKCQMVERNGLASNYFALDELARWSMIIEKTREFSDRCQANKK